MDRMGRHKIPLELRQLLWMIVGWIVLFLYGGQRRGSEMPVTLLQQQSPVGYLDAEARHEVRH